MSGTVSGQLRRDPVRDGLDPDAIERFRRDDGFTIERIVTRWSFRSRDDLTAVLRLELPPSVCRRGRHPWTSDLTHRDLLLHRTS